MAREAFGYGLLNRVVPAEQLTGHAAELAAQLAESSAHARMLTKRQFRAVGNLSFDAALAMEATHQGLAAAHPDHLERRTAFTEKRAARWAS